MKIYKAGEEMLSKRAEKISSEEFETEKLTRLIEELMQLQEKQGLWVFQHPSLAILKES